MGDWPEFFAFGGGLVAVACLFGWFLWKGRTEAPDDDQEERFLKSQRRRRLQVCAMIGLVGLIMIACGFIDPESDAITWWSLVLACLLIAAWIALLGMADALATWAFRSRQLRSINSQRRVAEAELERLKRGSISPGETK